MEKLQELNIEERLAEIESAVELQVKVIRLLQEREQDNGVGERRRGKARDSGGDPNKYYSTRQSK